MSSTDLVSQQFDRAVEIVQSLPKTGPIQTQYDEKLTMYALYKQATVGNVQGPRPGMWDMLGKAKWDAWSKHKDLSPLEAKWLYVDALLRVLRKYSDKTMAKTYVEELESFGGDPGNLVLSRSFSKSRLSGSSGSTQSGGRMPIPLPGKMPEESGETDEEEEESDDDEDNEEVDDVPQRLMSPVHRPPSSALSSNRYRTPMAGSLALSPAVPPVQPLASFETPSAFGENPAAPHYPPPGTTSSYVGQYSSGDSIPSHYPVQPLTSRPQSTVPYGLDIRRSQSRGILESAVENVQAHIAALTERMDSFQSGLPYPPSRRISQNSRAFTVGGSTGNPSVLIFDLDDLGLWSYIVQPVARCMDLMKEAATFLARNENRTPGMIIIRRLFLDVSFLFCVVAVIRMLWRKSGVRRQEVKAALRILWRAIIGSKERVMVDRGV